MWRRDVWYRPTDVSEELANYINSTNDHENRDNMSRKVGVYLQDLFRVTSVRTLNRKACWRFGFFTLTLSIIYTSAEQLVTCGEHEAFDETICGLQSPEYFQ
jgi:hypothetical protein